MSSDRANPIPGFDGYYRITPEGEVYSFYWTNPKLCKTHHDPLVGYKFVVLRLPYSKPKRYKTLRIHQALMLTYVGKPEIGQCISHRDGDKWNNALSNLEYVSYKENTKECVLAGRHNQPGKRKLTEHERGCIVAAKRAGVLNNSQIAEKYQVHPRSVQRIYQEETNAEAI